MASRSKPLEVKPLFGISKDPTSKKEAFGINVKLEEGQFVPFEYQIPAIDFASDRLVSGEIVAGINTTTGSGKSVMGTFVAIRKARQNPKMRLVMLVPQEIIGSSWRHERGDSIPTFVLNDGKAIWGIATDLCACSGRACSSTTSKVDAFIEFLEAPAAKSVHLRTCIVTHATFARAFKQLVKEGRERLLNNLLTICDEIQHAVIDDHDKSNYLGRGLGYILDNGKSLNSSLLFLTATLFRGDRVRIFGKKYQHFVEDAFYCLPFDEYFKYFKYLQEIDYAFGLFPVEDGYKDCISNIVRNDGVNKTIIFIPRRGAEGTHFPSSKKNTEIKNVLAGIAAGHGWNDKVETIPHVASDGSTSKAIFKLRVGADKWITVANAVEDNGRIRKGVKKFLRNVNKGKDDVDVIIALGMCREGFDWVACNRIILIGNVGSLTDLVQVNGRMIRDYFGKSIAKMTWLLPCSKVDDSTNEKDVAKALNKALISIHLALMMCLDVMQPINLLVPKKGNPNEKEEMIGGDLLSMLFKEDKIVEFLDQVSAKIVACERVVTMEERIGIVSNILSDMGVSQEDIDTYAESVAVFTKRRAAAVVANKTFRLSINFDSPLIKEMAARFKIVNLEDLPPESFIAAYAAESINLTRYKEFRRAVNNISHNAKMLEFYEFKDKMDEFRDCHKRDPNKDAEDPYEKSLADEVRYWKQEYRPFIEEQRRMKTQEALVAR